MRRMSETSRPRLAWAVAGIALLSACSDTPSGPGGRGEEIVRGRSDSMFVSNARQYAQTGKRPGTGRSGSATLSAWALLGQDGAAQIELVAGGWSGWTRSRRMVDQAGSARLTKAQLKVYNPDGVQLYSRIHTINAPSASIPAEGLVRGGRAQVHAMIDGADYRRVGVITMDVPVALRPDLAVSAVEAAEQVPVNTPVSIVGVVRELNGDVGAWADCVLYVDGAERDRARGIWIDAGGTVSCLFTQSFATSGTPELEVRLEGVAPGDYQLPNNAARRTINVAPATEASPFKYSAFFDDRSVVSTLETVATWGMVDGSSGGEDTRADTTRERTQFSALFAMMPRSVQFPLHEVIARQYTDIEEAHRSSFADLAEDWSTDDGTTTQRCVSRGEDDLATGRAWVYLCSYTRQSTDGSPPSGWTTLQYERYAGEVTYASVAHSRYWDRDLGIEDVYTENTVSGDTLGRFVRYGQQFAFAVQIRDVERTSSVNATVGLLPFTSSGSEPEACFSWQDPYVSARTCTASSRAESGVSGAVEGEPNP